MSSRQPDDSSVNVSANSGSDARSGQPLSSKHSMIRSSYSGSSLKRDYSEDEDSVKPTEGKKRESQLRPGSDFMARAPNSAQVFSEIGYRSSTSNVDTGFPAADDVNTLGATVPVDQSNVILSLARDGRASGNTTRVFAVGTAKGTPVIPSPSFARQGHSQATMGTIRDSIKTGESRNNRKDMFAGNPEGAKTARKESNTKHAKESRQRTKDLAKTAEEAAEAALPRAKYVELWKGIDDANTRQSAMNSTLHGVTACLNHAASVISARSTELDSTKAQLGRSEARSTSLAAQVVAKEAELAELRRGKVLQPVHTRIAIKDMLRPEGEDD